MFDFGTAAAMSALDTGFNILGQTVNGLTSNLFYKRNLNLQKEAQKELIDYQNAYNTPSAQMQRLAEAGLNPHLVYGSQAPAGISGNAPAPSGAMPSGGFNTSDVTANMLRLQQMKGVESQIDLNDSIARKNNAEATYTEMMAGRYNELTDVQIREANQRMEESASRMDLNKSTIQWQSADKALKLADEAFRRGEIGLQQYRKQLLIAQSNLYRTQASLNKANESYVNQLEDNAKVQYALDKLQEAYDRVMKDPNTATKTRDAKLQILQKEAQDAAAEAGITGSKFVQWTEWAFDRIEQGSKIWDYIQQ